MGFARGLPSLEGYQFGLALLVNVIDNSCLPIRGMVKGMGMSSH